jgi:AspT/YidE/YbjL antiporter-like protein
VIVDLLVEHTVLLYFLYIAIGAVLGQIRIRGVLIGPAAVLFSALAISAIDERLALPEIVGQIGLVLFAYCVGVNSGPTFFDTLRTGGRAVALVAVTLLVGAGVAMGAGALTGLSPALTAGAFTGALTNTPALAAATEQLESAEPTVGYSVTYVFGVVGMLIAVAFALRGKTEPKVSAVPEPEPELTMRSVRVENTGLPSLRDLITEFDDRIRFSRVRHDRRVSIATDDFRPAPGDVVSVIGPANVVSDVVDRLGHESSLHLELDRKALDFRRIAVSNHAVAGRPLGELGLLDRFGATATRVRRGDIDFLATEDLLQRLDDVFDALLGVAEEHLRVLLEEQRVLHAGIAGVHRALEDDDVSRPSTPQHRHPGDRAGRVVLGGGVDRVVGADDQHDVGLGEVVVDLVHLQDDVVGHLGLGQQDVHVAREPTGDRVDAEPDVDAAVLRSLRVRSATAYCACATAMPYPG